MSKSKSQVSDVQFRTKLEQTKNMLDELKKMDEQKEIAIGKQENILSFMQSVSQMDANGDIALQSDQDYQKFN